MLTGPAMYVFTARPVDFFTTTDLEGEPEPVPPLPGAGAGIRFFPKIRLWVYVGGTHLRRRSHGGTGEKVGGVSYLVALIFFFIGVSFLLLDPSTHWTDHYLL